MLQLLHKQATVDFDQIADVAHGAKVDDSAIEKTIQGARKAIAKWGLPYRLVASQRTVRAVRMPT